MGVSRLLKGSVPAKITLTAQNDSGGYRMSVGEKHLLFLSSKGRTYETDPCGNSTGLPKGDKVLKRLTALLRAGAARPN